MGHTHQNLPMPSLPDRGRGGGVGGGDHRVHYNRLAGGRGAHDTVREGGVGKYDYPSHWQKSLITHPISHEIYSQSSFIGLWLRLRPWTWSPEKEKEIAVLDKLTISIEITNQSRQHSLWMLVEVHRINMRDWLKVLFYFGFLPYWYTPIQPVSSRLQNYVINFHIIYVLSVNWCIYYIL